jgi:hypothetical protein
LVDVQFLEFALRGDLWEACSVECREHYHGAGKRGVAQPNSHRTWRQ